MAEIEKREGKPIKKVLRDLYKCHNSQEEVAQILGISQGTLSIWLKLLGLQQKTILVSRRTSQE